MSLNSTSSSPPNILSLAPRTNMLVMIVWKPFVPFWCNKTRQEKKETFSTERERVRETLRVAVWKDGKINYSPLNRPPENCHLSLWKCQHKKKGALEAEAPYLHIHLFSMEAIVCQIHTLHTNKGEKFSLHLAASSYEPISQAYLSPFVFSFSKTNQQQREREKKYITASEINASFMAATLTTTTTMAGMRGAFY